MLELIKQYGKAKEIAIALMQDGKLAEYMIQLTKVQKLKVALVKLS